MHIAITSDIHFHLPWLNRYQHLVSELAAREPDFLILAGDIGEPLSLYEQALSLYATVTPHRAILSGNHDVWHRSESNTSRDLWESLLPAAAEQHGYHWLEGENLKFGALGICGSVAWYDYTSANDTLGISSDEYQRIKPMLSNDGRYIDWPWTDRDFSEIVGEAFQNRLDALEDDDSIHDILVVTHVPPFANCLRHADNEERAVINAFYGNLTFGKRILKTTKARSVVSGHVHRDCAFSIQRDDGGEIAVNIIPADYGKPAALIVDTETWTVETLRINNDQG